MYPEITSNQAELTIQVNRDRDLEPNRDLGKKREKNCTFV